MLPKTVFTALTMHRFRCVDCQLTVLCKCSSVAAVKRALTSLPKVLDETYERILVNVQKDPEAEKACRALR